MTKRTGKGRRDGFPMFIVSLVVFGVTAAVAVFTFLGGGNGGNTLPASATPAQVLPLPPEIRDNLTRIPQTTPEADERADYEALRAAVAACPEYDEGRRLQMETHLAWLLEPASIPRDILIALGERPLERLIGGMGTYTVVAWRLGGEEPDSCLVEIGRDINALLLEAEETPVAAFE